MRTGALIAVALTSQILFGHGFSNASYYDGQWCAVYGSSSDSIAERCDYRDFETCRMDIIAGNRGFCRPNGYYTAEQAKGGSKANAHKRKSH